VVIVGAGFAGLWTARGLEGTDLRVTLVDRHNYHTFLPLLYQVAAAELGPSEIAYPVRSILRRAPNVEFRLGELEGVDPEAREVVVAGERVGYDHLVLAMGATTHFFGVEGAAEHAFPLRTMAEAIPLRHHILARFEAAAHERDPGRRRRLLSFTIVGGGPTGVEFSGALAELIHGPLRKDYPMLRLGREDAEVRILLVEAMDQLLGGMPRELADYARDRLEARGVEVRLGTPVNRVTPDGVVLEGGEEVASETVVWTGGVRGVDGPSAWGLPMGPQGRVRAAPTLQVEGFDDVWVAGDLTWLEQDGEPLPGVAPVAIQQGEHVARSLVALADGRPPEPFRFRDPGMLAVVGRNAAVAHLRGRSFRGFPAWILWLVIHVAKLIGFRNRVLVLVNWAWNYLFFERAVRLILPDARGRSSEEREAT
jgi:NADH:ubiquinone reductase (H+-translocating)